ncbi:hypothetical protein ACFLQL_04055 [Verrucomicrobiota bacterium]
MILFYNPNPVGNMLNIIEGIESRLMMDIHGHISVDITPLIEVCDKSKPIILNFTKTDSEIKTMTEIKETGMPYPFFAPMLVMGPNSKSEGKMGTIGKDGKTEAFGYGQAESISDTDKTKQNPSSINIAIGKCPLCGNDKVELIKIAGTNSICAACFKLNMNLVKLYTDKKERKVKRGRPTNESKTSI